MAGIQPLLLFSKAPTLAKASVFFDELEPRAFKKGEELDIYYGDVYSPNSIDKSMFPLDLFCDKPKGFDA